MAENIVLVFHAKKNFESETDAQTYYKGLKTLLQNETGLCISANINKNIPMEIAKNGIFTPITQLKTPA